MVPVSITNPRMIDLTGLVFGRLTVKFYVGKGRWLCRCECGTELTPLGLSLRERHTQSCGCLQREVVGKSNFRHGYSRQAKIMPEYQAWYAMKRRCKNKKGVRWKDYGGRGIKVCDRWLESFEAFLQDVGHRPSPQHSIDRIDTNGNYEPGNVRWVTRDIQNRNKRSNRLVTFDGTTLCLTDWATRVGMSESRLRSRLNRGWSIERALTILPGTPA